MPQGAKAALEGGWLIKPLLICLPPVYVMEIGHVHNRLLVGGSWVAGALLQAAVPPARKGLVPTLIAAIIVGTLNAWLWP